MLTRTRLIATTSLALVALLGGIAAAKPSVGKTNRVGGGGDIRSNSNSSDIRLSASAGTVAYYSNGKFKSSYRERITSSTVTQKFKFEVEAFTPNAEVPVLLNGVFVANVIVNPTGGGEFQFTSADNNPGANDLPLPSGFPRLRAGDTITIGNLTATFN